MNKLTSITLFLALAFIVSAISVSAITVDDTIFVTSDINITLYVADVSVFTNITVTNETITIIGFNRNYRMLYEGTETTYDLVDYSNLVLGAKDTEVLSNQVLDKSDSYYSIIYGQELWEEQNDAICDEGIGALGTMLGMMGIVGLAVIIVLVMLTIKSLKDGNEVDIKLMISMLVSVIVTIIVLAVLLSILSSACWLGENKNARQ